MLFQAGMGIGLVFWAVSEPLTHYVDPPLGMAKPETAGAATLALQTAFSTGACTHGPSTPSSASPSPTSATAGA